MNSYRPNRNRQFGVSFFGMIMLAALMSVAAFGFDALSGGLVRSYARTMSSLAWRAVDSVVAHVDASGVLHSRRTLAEENAALKTELAKRDEEAVRFSMVQNENTALQHMVHLTETSQSGVTARVLSSFQSSPYGTFIIGAGKNDGLATGDAVLSSGGFLIGAISDIDAHTATVQMLFAPSETIDLSTGAVAFTGDGRGGGNARAEIPRDAKVALGDVVTARKFGGKPAGVIGSIESASSSATQTLFIRLPVNLDTLDFVYVVQ